MLTSLSVLTPCVPGIPRNGAPDPQHGCVRTPVGCGAGNSSAGTGCDSGHSCVRDVCLQSCQTDTHCALGERCITENEAGQESKVCIKICFYDAHCLAGEYCEENVCRPGCRSDSNCPFGQICAAGPQRSIRECEDGCHFSNDCPIGQVRRSGVYDGFIIVFTALNSSLISLQPIILH